MKTRIIGLSAAVAAAALTGFAAQTRAGGDKVAFPANYDKGVLYTTVDRADNKQYRQRPSRRQRRARRCRTAPC